MLDTVRVFVSSTFQDMHAERDRLNRFVYPRIEESCRRHGMDFVAVDLRWGISREAAEHHEVVELCMREIDRCQPFFIGLIGDRYGWIPTPDWIPETTFNRVRDGLPVADARLLERFYRLDESLAEPKMRARSELAGFEDARLDLVRLWEEAGLPGAGRSITELEIDRALNGAGRNPRMLVYCRDPALHAEPDFPDGLVPAFTSIDPDDRQRLARFRERLGKLGKPHVVRTYSPRYAGLRIESIYLPERLSEQERKILDDGVIRPEEWRTLGVALRSAIESHGTVALDGLEAWGEQVANDLWTQIEAEAAAPSGKGRARARIADPHERFILDRTRLFVGRGDLIDQVAGFAAADDSAATLLVTGAPGSGKSAFLAQCAVRCRTDDPRTLVVGHFIGAAPGTTDLHLTLRSILERLIEGCGLDLAVPEDPRELEYSLTTFLEHAASKRRVVLMIDALNQLDPAGDSHLLRWLPARMPAGARLIVSTLAGECLDRMRQRVGDDRIIELEGLGDGDRQDLVRRALAIRGKRLARSQLERLLDTDTHRDATLPLYLLVALEELSMFGDFEGLDRRIAGLPQTLAELFDQVLDRLELDHSRAPTELVLRLIAVARSGLLESEILDLVSAETGTSPLWWSQLRFALNFYLQGVDNERAEGVTDFYHDQLRIAVYRRYLQMAEPGSDATAACIASHRVLADYFLARARDEQGWRVDAGRPLAELTFHQAHARLESELAGLLCDPGFLSAKVKAHPPATLISDYDLLATEAATAAGVDGKGLRWIQDALRLSSHVLSKDPSELPSQLWARLLPRSSPAIDALRSSLESSSAPWLCPYATTLTPAGMPLRRTLTGMNCVSGVVVSPDDSLALCHDDDSILWIWDLRSGALRRSIETKRTEWIFCSAVHPSRALAIVAKDNGGIFVVDMEAGVILRELPSPPDLEAIAFSSDGTSVWTAHEGGLLGCVALDGQGKPQTIETGWGDIAAIAVGAGDRAFLGVGDTIEEWDLARRSRIRSLNGHADSITALRLSPDERRLAVGFNDGSIELWDLAGESCRTLAGHHDRGTRNIVSGLAFTPSGDRLLSGSWDETLRVWDPERDEPVTVLRGHSSSVYAVAMLHDGRHAVSASKDGTIRVWDLAADPVAESPFLHGAAVDALAARVDAAIAVSGSRDRAIGVWDLTNGEALRHWPAHEGTELHEGWIAAISLTPKADRVHSAGRDGALRSWDPQSGGKLWEAKGDWGNDAEMAFSEDGSVLVTDDGGHDDVRLSFWRPGRKKKLGTLKVGHSRSVIGVSPDGSVAIFGDLDGGFVVVDIAKRAVLWAHDAKPQRSSNYPESVAVNRGGTRAILGFKDGHVELWDLAAQRKRRNFPLHADRVVGLAIEPRGELACSASWDRTLRVWELETGRVIGSYSSDDFWSSCIFAGSDDCIVAGDERGSVHFLRLASWPQERSAERRRPHG